MPNSYNILLVGGTFNNTANPDGSYGAVSGVLRHVYNALNNYPNFLSNFNVLPIIYLPSQLHQVPDTLLS